MWGRQITEEDRQVRAVLESYNDVIDGLTCTSGAIQGRNVVTAKGIGGTHAGVI